MSLHDRVIQESALRRALGHAFDTPVEHGGPTDEEKERAKERAKGSLAALVKKAVRMTAKKLIPRTEEDVMIPRTLRALAEAERVSMSDIMRRAKPAAKPAQIARRLPGAKPPPRGSVRAPPPPAPR